MNDHLDRVRLLTNILDARFNVLGFKFGIDPLLSAIPGLGSAIGALTSFYIFWIGWKSDIPKELQTRMFVNIIVDLLLGSVPVAGIVFDAFFKSNIRNLKILEEHFGNK